MRQLFCAVILGFASLATGAFGQTSWSYEHYDDGRVGAVACPVFDAEVTGNYQCIILGCDPGEALEWQLVFAGAGTMPDVLNLDFGVDGQARGRVSVSRVQSQFPYDYRVKVAAERDAGLIEALKSASRGSLGLSGGGEKFTDRPLSMRGSSRAISAVQAACPVAKPRVADPVATALAGIRETCANMDGEVTVEDGFVREEDFDGDGRDDLYIDYGYAPCSKMASLYCGSGGCSADLYLARDGGFEFALSTVMYGVMNEPGAGVTALVHGNACGTSNASACAIRFDLGGTRPRLVEKLSGQTALDWMERLNAQ